jgi:divalent metal cation (Fe/Co/Zn/Cd) transporter
VDGVESFHRVRSRGALGSAAVDLHVRISPQKTMREADLIADNVRQRLLALESVTDVTVHVEAQRGTDLSPGDRMSQLKRIAREVGLTMHETEFNRLEGNLFLDVHLGVDPSLTLGEAHDLVESYAQTVKQQNPDIDEIHTHIEMASTQVQQGVPAPERIQHLVEVETKNIIANMPALQNPHQFLILKKQNEDNGFYVSFECMIAADMPISTAHQYASQVERELIQRIPEVIDVSVHLEPPRTT